MYRWGVRQSGFIIKRLMKVSQEAIQLFTHDLPVINFILTNEKKIYCSQTSNSIVFFHVVELLVSKKFPRSFSTSRKTFDQSGRFVELPLLWYIIFRRNQVKFFTFLFLQRCFFITGIKFMNNLTSGDTQAFS